jgi:hypothetical protein
MGTVSFNTNVDKAIDISKLVNLDVNKSVTSIVDLTGSLASAQASADAVGVISGPIEPGFSLVDSVGDLGRGEIHEEWWDRALNFDFPGGVLPFSEPTGALQGLGQDVPGVFLVDGSGGEAVTRSFSVPFGDTLAIPLVNFIYLADPGEDPVPPVTGLFETIIPDTLFLTVDGEQVPLDELLGTRAASGPFDLTVAEGGFLNEQFGFEPGDIIDSAVDGYLVLLEGLDPGPHTIMFGGATEDGFAPETTINIQVPAPQGALAETETFAQVNESGAFSFSDALAALGSRLTDDLIL